MEKVYAFFVTFVLPYTTNMTTSDDIQPMGTVMQCFVEVGESAETDGHVGVRSLGMRLDGRGVSLSRVNCRITLLIEFPVAWSRSRPPFWANSITDEAEHLRSRSERASALGGRITASFRCAMTCYFPHAVRLGTT
jgi:hypothetical protein